MAVTNLSQLLQHSATAFPNKGITCLQDGRTCHTSYSDLFSIAEINAAQIRKLAGRGSPIFLIHFDNHWDNIVWFWSVVLAGYIPAMSTPLVSDGEQREKHLLHLHRLLEDPIVLTSTRLQSDLATSDSQFQLQIRPIEKFGDESSEWSGTSSSVMGSSDIAALMLTSGSTGHAKAVTLRHGQIVAALNGKSQYHETTSEDVFLSWIGMDHVANLTEIHLHAMHLGADQVQLPAGDVINDPLLFLQQCAQHRVSYTFAPNFFLATLLRSLQKGEQLSSMDLSRLRALISGGEANVVETCDDLSKILMDYGAPRSLIRPGFGMTETCAGSIYGKNCPEYDISRGLEFASLGSCVPGMFVRVVESSGRVLNSSEVGYLEVSGPVVFSGYYNNYSATTEAFPTKEWFRTGDLAFIDDAGQLTMTGRAKDTVNINGLKYPIQELETAIEEADIKGLTPSYTAIFPHRVKGSSTEAIVVVYLPDYSPEHVETRVKVARSVSQSSLGKLSRAKLRRAFEEGKFKEIVDMNNRLVAEYQQHFYTAPRNKTEAKLLDVVRSSLDIAESIKIGIDTDFSDLGVTSVEILRLKSRIDVALRLSKSLPIGTLLVNRTIRQLGKAIAALQESPYEPMTILQPDGNKTPLWLVHPGVGEVLIFIQLARYMTDRPVYGLRARGLDGEQPFTSISEAVQAYHESIRRTQPKGPYAIAGYSYGSNLAFEVAKLIEADGDEVKFLGAFDQPPHLAARSQQFDWVDCVLFVSFFLGLITEEQAKHTLGCHLRNLSREDALSHILDNAPKDRVDELAITRKKLADWAGVAFQLKVIGREYDPTGKVARLDCFYAAPLPEVASTMKEWDAIIAEWAPFVKGDVGYHRVDGGHYDMITTHVRSFQKRLKQVLEDRGV
ncbi:luciferin 4-monooxygenase [Pyrenophora tritici-repentis Pt-1C-BFP]|uniref:Luciferin 4-monooxygenase n=1 Tax=Pyrenophora tritici-repentis (strain Pt-1C-BFP) TaxID=426418 RepID=B2VX30_PYRTR|nr:luciferin 4-monooxygenase [Pyrenophora tritici-repentis Pt-1C-BFP]EDU39705.1 luciferin 4-monooxygenase [Pyrenophora tritici-repentis Pt-1C-BFP]